MVTVSVAVGVVAIAVIAQLDRARGVVHCTLDGAAVSVAALLIVLAVWASGTAVVWLTFAFSLGIVGLAVTRLTLHEVSNWRPQRQLASLHWLPNTSSPLPQASLRPRYRLTDG